MATPPLDSKPERYYAIEAMVAEGKSIREIVRTLHVDFQTVKNYFPNAGRPDRARGLTLQEKNPEKYKKMALMVAQGCSLNEITRTLGVDHRTIKRAFPNAGWKKGSAQHKQSVADAKKFKEIEGRTHL